MWETLSFEFVAGHRRRLGALCRTSILSPLQEGILFHHKLATDGDPYLLYSMYGFDSRARLDAYLG